MSRTPTQAIIQAIEEGYKGKYPSGFGDEHCTPYVAKDKNGKPFGRIEQDDSVIFFNFRQDRAREISEALTGVDREGKPFSHFPIKKDLNLDFVSMTEYHKNFDFPIAFPKIKLSKILSQILSDAGIKQLRIAETEKYAHVTFFMNGGEEKKYPGEDWLLVKSPNVATYDLQPEMSAPELTQKVIENIRSKQYGFILLNYANPDMVGHTGVEPSILKAVEIADQGVGQIVEAMQEQNGIVLITADHGNCEEMYAIDRKGEIIYQNGKPKPSTEHSADKPVPFIVYGPKEVITQVKLREVGVLADLSPTILELLNLKQPEEMTGKSMLKDYSHNGKRHPMILIVLDGWGITDRKEGNAPLLGNTPNMKRLAKEYPNSQLIPFGKAVGLPEGTMGNSEVGHMNIGAGRVVHTDYERINTAINDESFYTNPVLLEAVRHAIRKGKALHFQGLISNIGVHERRLGNMSFLSIF